MRAGPFRGPAGGGDGFRLILFSASRTADRQNLHAELLVTLRDALLARTGRDLVLAGILADREVRVRDAFDPALGEPHRTTDGEWVCLAYRRTS